MRLIDADELKKDLRIFLANDNHVNNSSTTYLDVLDVVEEQPTAYDIDKVVKKLDELEDVGGSWTHKHIYAHKAIEIVEQGVR